MFYYSRDRAGEHPQAHLANYAGIFQADAYSGYTKLYEPDRKPGPLVEAACWVHARRPFFIMADVAANARRKAHGKTTSVISPLALEGSGALTPCSRSNARSMVGAPSGAGRSGRI